MGLLRKLFRIGGDPSANHRVDPAHRKLRPHVCRFEQFEPRRAMAADLHVGSVYYEQAGGDDALPNMIEFTFEGGAPGTQLTRIIIDGDKDGQGRSSGDVFFDTAPGGLGVFKSSPLQIVSHDGFQVVNTQVVDGGMRMVIDLVGFEVGEKLVISVDVDESQFVDPQSGEIDVNAVAEGGEFQRSHFIASFQAPHYHDITTSVQFWDEFNQRFAEAEQSTGSHLELPPDRYRGPIDLSDFTAGAVAQAEQIPLPSSISGVVFVDQNLNNLQDPGDEGIGNVTVTLMLFNGSAYVPTGLTTVTDTLGNYHFDGLAPGKYRIVETQPVGYFSVGARAGTVEGITRGVVTSPDIISDVELLGGDDSVRNDFAEALPNSISGYVNVDVDQDCITDPGEPPIAGVVLHLLNDKGQVIATTTTNAQGFYEFKNLAPGTYGVFEEQPAGYLNGCHSVGTAGGEESAVDTVTEIVLTSGIHGEHYDFRELEPVSISGRVHINTTGDCADPANPPLAGVTIELLNATGQVIDTTVTNADGYYIFDALPPGTYTVHEIQPLGYYNGATFVGSAGGVKGVDIVSQIVLTSGTDAVHYDFCELLPVSISGRVHVNTTGDCANPENPPLAGVTIELLNSSGTIIATRVTDADGYYIFDALPPGTYTVRELQPEGYFSGATFVGSAGGTKGSDIVSDIELKSGTQAVHYDFCEIPPAELCGWVYVDTNNNGLREAGEVGIANVTLVLKDGNGVPTGMTVLTDATGHYCFEGLRPGEYTVSEIQPVGYLDGLDTPGTEGGFAQNPGDTILGISLKAGVHAEEYNFGELLPVSIGGRVHVNTTGDCTDPANPPLSGVTVELLDANGSVIDVAITGNDGRYLFDNLPPGTYSVRETQPLAYFNGATLVGSAGGVQGRDLITDIVLIAGTDAVDYDFCEIPPAMLSGYVFQDGPPIPLSDTSQTIYVPDYRDGKLTPDDTRLPGVTLMLRDGVTGAIILGSAALPGTYTADQPITVFTDVNGYYEFAGLRSGTYAVYEVAPGGYIPGIDTAGSYGGIVVSAWTVVDPAVLAQLTDPPPDDAILQIGLPTGKHSTDNNFSVVLTQPEVQVFVIPPPLAPEPLVPAGFNPPLLPLFAPPPPLLPFLLPPALTRTGGQLYTWHLSVIDAGQPRVAQTEGSAQFQLTSSANVEEIAWRRDDMGDSEWSLLTDLAHPESARRVHFGMKGGIPLAGDFNGDGTFEVAIFREGRWYIDLNDNGTWDEGDLWAKLGRRGDRPVTGDWDGDGKTDIGIYGPAWLRDPRAIVNEPGMPDPHNENTAVHKNIPRPPHRTAVGKREMKRTAEGRRREDVIDHVFLYGLPGDHPVVGDWNGDGVDTIAVFKDGRWNRDIDGDGKWTNSDVRENFGQKGDVPIVGDFNGDGIDDLGVYRDGVWYIDTNGNGVIDDDDLVFNLGGPGDLPVVGDWDGDGKTDVGVCHGASPAARTVRK
ncbi:MAG: SdrD B-like domain-containing protein [Pirellulales bacterium]